MPAVNMQIFSRDEIKLDIEERSERGKGPVGRLRRDGGMLPGIIYGRHREPLPFKVETLSLERALSKGGQDAVFLLQMSGNGSGDQAVVREIQYHKVTGDILHVDMLRIDPEEHLRVEVPISTVGIPVGVHVGGGAVQHSLQRLEMVCLASELPSRVEIDIAELDIGSSIHVSDLLEQDSRITTDPSTTIVSVLSPRLTVDEEPVEEEGEEEELLEDEAPEDGESEQTDGGEDDS
ncbi:MAG: 50S ribosomal protein L25 [Gemmatimonadetes bacterium]|nr:50S ribosomal protein L25 [Gemmatimonadota bacterium]